MQLWPRAWHLAAAAAAAPPSPVELCRLRVRWLCSISARARAVAGGEEKARPLAEWHHISKFEQEDKVTQVALLKVYKEYDDSAWNLWRASGAKDVAEFVGGDAKALMAALKEAQAKHKAVSGGGWRSNSPLPPAAVGRKGGKAAAHKSAEGARRPAHQRAGVWPCGYDDDVVRVRCAAQWKAVEAKAQADAEESGEEVTKDLRAHHWRYSVPGLVMGGESLDAAEHDVKNNLLNYDGELRRCALGAHYSCPRGEGASGVGGPGGRRRSVNS